VAAAVATLDAHLPSTTAPALRDAALVATLLRALAPGERERLYAAGSLAGPQWLPTEDPQLNVLLRVWAFTERADRGAAARAAGGRTVVPLPPAPRRRSAPPLLPPAPATRRPFDPEAAWEAINRAAERLAAADADAMATNARVERLIHDEFA
jgi:hypothetical protein